MAAHHVTDPARFCQPKHSVEAGGECRHFLDAQPSRVDGLTRQQEAGPRVKDRDRAFVVARSPGHLENPASKIELNHLIRPTREAIEIHD